MSVARAIAVTWPPPKLLTTELDPPLFPRAAPALALRYGGTLAGDDPLDDDFPFVRRAAGQEFVDQVAATKSARKTRQKQKEAG